MTPPNLAMLKKLLIVTVTMFAFGFALIPFYKKICEVTGINNLLQPDTLTKDAQINTGRSVTVELDANVHKLPWKFRPLKSSVQIHPGELVQVMYEIRNDSNYETTGQAIPSYAPKLLSLHLKKLECFCFSKQVLKPHEVRQMPVQFVIESELPTDINTVTLSYTFFEINRASASEGENKLAKI